MLYSMLCLTKNKIFFVSYKYYKAEELLVCLFEHANLRKYWSKLKKIFLHWIVHLSRKAIKSGYDQKEWSNNEKCRKKGKKAFVALAA